MPNFNSLGEWCAGVGGVAASWGSSSGTGTLIPGGAAPDWMTDDVVVVQDCTGGSCVVKTYNVRTGVSTVVAPRGASNISAGGGVWAVWLGGYGVYSSTGLYLPASYIGPVGPDGAIAVKRFYASYGPWDVRETSGAVWTLTAGDAQYIQLLGSHRAVWTEGGQPYTVGCPTPNPITRPFYGLKMLAPSSPTDPDGWWCLYQDATGRLLLHPVASTSGYLVAGAGLAYRPDLVRLSPTSIKVVWATAEGESPADVVVSTITTTATRTAFGSGLIVPPIAPFIAPALLGYFPYATSGGAAPGSFLNQNCRIDFTPHSGVFDNRGTKILSFVDTEYDLSHGMTIEASISAQPAPRLVYWGDRFTRTAPPAGYWSTMTSGDVPACPVYRDPGETDAALASAGTAQLAAAAAHGFSAVLVAGVWNRNNTLANQVVLDGGPVARGWLDNASCKGLFFFGINRGATAVPPQFVPEFQTLVDRFRVGSVETGPANWPVAFRTGLIARVAAAEAGGAATVQFGTDTPISVPSHGLYAIGAILSGVPTIIMQAVDDVARTVTRTGTITAQGGTFGTDGVWIDDGGVIVNVTTAFTVSYGGVSHAHPYPGGQGIAEAGSRPFSAIAWMDARLSGTVYGRAVARWSSAGAYTVAQDAVTGYGIVYDGVVWRLAIATPLVVAPRVTVLDSGGAIVTCFPGYVVPEADWTILGGPGDGGSGPGGGPGEPPGGVVTPRFNPAVVVPSGRQYPHVDGITDWRAQQTSRLLWDRVYDAHDKIEASTSQIDALRELLLAHDKRVDELQVAAGEALAEAQRARGAGDGGGGTDFGAGAAGCASAGSTGHVTAGTLTVGLAGQIICGTGAEFPALLVATATRALQEANRSELLDRMIWHLGQAGFAASRYHTDQAQYYHLLFDAIAVDGTPVLRQYAYRVLSYMPDPDAAWDPTLVITTGMVFGGQELGLTTAAEPGIAD